MPTLYLDSKSLVNVRETIKRFRRKIYRIVYQGLSMSPLCAGCGKEITLKLKANSIVIENTALVVDGSGVIFYCYDCYPVEPRKKG